MTGINRYNNSINIKAVAYNYELENAINEMYEEILNKHLQVKQILKDNDINIDDININIDVSQVIKEELLILWHK